MRTPTDTPDWGRVLRWLSRLDPSMGPQDATVLLDGFIRELYDAQIIYAFDWPAWGERAERLIVDPGALGSAPLSDMRKLLTPLKKTRSPVETFMCPTRDPAARLGSGPLARGPSYLSTVQISRTDTVWDRCLTIMGLRSVRTSRTTRRLDLAG